MWTPTKICELFNDLKDFQKFASENITMSLEDYETLEEACSIIYEIKEIVEKW